MLKHVSSPKDLFPLLLLVFIKATSVYHMHHTKQQSVNWLERLDFVHYKQGYYSADTLEIVFSSYFLSQINFSEH